jgi:ABC-2 type transport system ATP-binding protein
MMQEMTTVDPPAVATEGVSHCYGRRQALDDVTFSITPSTFAVLLGLNGAGKSTLFSLITRLYAIQRGHIRIFGRDVGHASSEALRMIGVVFQLRTLDLDLSVIQNLTYHAALHGIGKHDGCARADDVLARIELSDRANDKVRKLSGGQMRRVEIARALLHRPRLLVLDEPTVGLDIKSRADILGYVRRLVVEDGSVLWATHLIDEVSNDDGAADPAVHRQCSPRLHGLRFAKWTTCARCGGGSCSGRGSSPAMAASLPQARIYCRLAGPGPVGSHAGRAGMLMSSVSKQLENFAGATSFVIFPMCFASSALYPLWRVREGSPCCSIHSLMRSSSSGSRFTARSIGFRSRLSARTTPREESLEAAHETFGRRYGRCHRSGLARNGARCGSSLS